MKKIIALLSLSLVLIVACEKEDLEEIITITQDIIPFEGNWERSFEAGPGGVHNATYAIHQDSMRYTIAGSFVNADYVIIKDTFLLTDNRFIGHTKDNIRYLLFVKDVSSTSISVYKQEVATVAVGMSIAIPAATTTENYGWSLYNKE